MVAEPQIPVELDAFNVTELASNDEWSGVSITHDFIGQTAEDFELHESVAGVAGGAV